MGMFTKYQDIANYIPNNLVCSFPINKSYSKLEPTKAGKPYEEYNAKGELIGYSWYHGETVNLEFNIDGEIVVEAGSLKYYAHGELPSSKTVGVVGQKAYNVIELRTWICTSADIVNNEYSWTEIPFEHDLAQCSESIYVSASDYLSDKQLELKLLNFRLEPIYSQVFSGTSKLVFTVDKELAAKLRKGIYYCSLAVVTDTIKTVVFEATDCKLLIK